MGNREVLGKYLRVKDVDESVSQIYHREKFENEEGFTLWYDPTPQWAVRLCYSSQAEMIFLREKITALTQICYFLILCLIGL